MKKLFFYLFVGLTITTTLISCNRNDEDNSNSENITGASATVTAENYGFDGNRSGKFSSTKAGIVKTSVAGMTILTISAIRDGGNESINMVLYGDVKAQTYSLGNGSQNGIVIRKDYQNITDQSKSYSTDNNGNNLTGGGEVKITSVNGNKIEGTFYAVGFNNAKSEAYAEQGKFSGTIN